MLIARKSRLLLMLIAVGGFILLDAAVFLGGWMLSRQIEADALVINVAGAQRMLSQRIGKLRLAVEAELVAGRTPSADVLDELHLSRDRLGGSMQAFLHGGEVELHDGRRVLLKPEQDSEARRILTDLQQLMAPRQVELDRLLAVAASGESMRDIQPGAWLAANRQLLDRLDRYVVRQQTLAEQRAHALRVKVVAVFALAFADFLFILWLFAWHLRQGRQAEAQLVGLFEHLGSGVVMLDAERRVLHANRSAQDLLGRSHAAMAGQVLDEVMEFHGERRTVATPEGRLRVLEWKEAPVMLNERILTLVSMQDVTPYHEALESLAHEAGHDPLTGLANRQQLLAALESAIGQARASGTMVGVMFIDLDRFKGINDELGHAAGDEALRQVAVRLRSLVRQTDLPARLAGDEFVVLMVGLRSGEDARAVLGKMEQALHFVFPWDGRMIEIHASAGLALFPEHGLDAASLLQHADQAMYARKRVRRQLEASWPVED